MDLGEPWWTLVDLGGLWWTLVDLGGPWWTLVDRQNGFLLIFSRFGEYFGGNISSRVDCFVLSLIVSFSVGWLKSVDFLVDIGLLICCFNN